MLAVLLSLLLNSAESVSNAQYNTDCAANKNCTVKIGVLLDGSGWSPGNQSFVAAVAAVEEINAREDLLNGVQLEYRWENSGCNEQKAIVAANTLLQWGANVLIGPGCSTACVPVSYLADTYDVPVISHACSGTELSEKKNFPNFGRTSESLQDCSDLLFLFFKNYQWELFNIVSATSTINLDLARKFIEAADEKIEDGVEYRLGTLTTIMIEASVENSTISQLYSSMGGAWIMFLPMYDKESDFILQKAYDNPHNDAKDFAWFRYQVAGVKPEYRKYYDKVFSLENEAPEEAYPLKYKDFQAKLNFSRFLTDEEVGELGSTNFLYNAYMYNAVYAWAYAYNKTLDSSSRYYSHTDEIIKNMKGLQFRGAYKMVSLNENAEPDVGVWKIRQYQTDTWVDVASMGKEDKAGTIVVNETLIKWHGDKVVDACADNRCKDDGNTTTLIAVIVVCALLVLTVILVSMYIVWKNKKQNKEDLKIDWKISFNDLDFSVKKSVSGSRKQLAEDDFEVTGMSVARYNHQFVVVTNLECSSINVTTKLLEELYMLKKMTHPNLNTFYGLCDDPGNCAVITSYCSKGSLQDLAHNENVHLDWMFKLSLIIDVAKGLKHLHTTSFGYHGTLRTSTCMVDSHWVCKITDFGPKSLKKDGASTNNSVTTGTSVNIRDLFYAAPEMLWPSTKERSVKELQKSDAYSFAIVMYELFAREPPYDTADIAPEKVINRIRARETPLFRPNVELMTITEKSSCEVGDEVADAIPREAVNLMIQCWAELNFERINMTEAVTILEDMNPDRSLSITDRVVKMMEKYAEDLENKVAKKTMQLQNEKQKAHYKISRFLPRAVLDKIENGLETEPYTDKEITGMCVRLKIAESLDQIAALNSYNEFTSSEMETREIYQAIDSNGHPFIVSGVFEGSESHVDTVVKYTQDLIEFSKQHKLTLKVAVHTGRTNGGVIMSDNTTPRLCLYGAFSTDLGTLLDSANYGQTILSRSTVQSMADDVKRVEHVKVKLSTGVTDSYLLQQHNKPLHSTTSAPVNALSALPSQHSPVEPHGDVNIDITDEADQNIANV